VPNTKTRNYKLCTQR